MEFIGHIKLDTLFLMFPSPSPSSHSEWEDANILENLKDKSSYLPKTRMLGPVSNTSDWSYDSILMTRPWVNLVIEGGEVVGSRERVPVESGGDQRHS